MAVAKMRLVDAHAHLFSSSEIALRAENGIITCFSAGTPEEWLALQPYENREEIFISFGVHPWYADRLRPEDWAECFRRCNLVGEIGMDSVWCAVPLAIQQKQLERQLEIAAELRKPVILHTKGQEERIADIIRGFPGKVCVHWYSGGPAAFARFLAQDCYFTLGPDTAALCEDEADGGLRRRMLKEIPLERLFTETDGVSAIAWARGAEQAAEEEIPEVLSKSVRCIAAEKGVPEEAAAALMEKNLRQFLE